MRNWLEMTPAEFGYTTYQPKRSVSASDVKALHAHVRKLRRAAATSAVKS